jgi:hypothetical protein
MMSSFMEEEPTTQWRQSSKLGPEWYSLGKGVMRCVSDMMLQWSFIHSKFIRW